MEDQFKRQPAIEKQIKDLTKEDANVAISGLVINKSENSFFLDDGTGQIAVSFSDSIEAEGYVRVFGRVIPSENGLEIQGEIVQDLNKIDKALYKKIKELLKR